MDSFTFLLILHHSLITKQETRNMIMKIYSLSGLLSSTRRTSYSDEKGSWSLSEFIEQLYQLNNLQSHTLELNGTRARCYQASRDSQEMHVVGTFTEHYASLLFFKPCFGFSVMRNILIMALDKSSWMYYFWLQEHDTHISSGMQLFSGSADFLFFKSILVP